MSGKEIGTAVKFAGWAIPAPEIPALMPDWVSFCMYQVPIITMAYLPLRKSLLASGYCCTPSAPFSMIPSLNICFQMVSALTMTGLDLVGDGLERVLVEGGLPDALHEAADAVGLEGGAVADPLGQGGRRREAVLAEQVLVDPDRAGVHRADRDGGQLLADHQAGDADGGELGLPVTAERLRDRGLEVDRVGAVGLDRAVGSAGRDVEDIGAHRGGQRGPQRGVVPGDGEHLVGDVDVRVDLVEGGDVLLRHLDRWGPAPPGEVG